MTLNKRKLEKKAFSLILGTGKEGLFQSELWKLLDITNREASRIVKKYEEKGKVYREKVLNNSRWTYKLYSIEELVTLDSIEKCPCLICLEVNRCYRGGMKDPTTCLDLTAWIDPRIEPVPL